MDTKLLLIKSITLLYRESQLTQHLDSSIDLVRTVIDGVKIVENSIGVQTEKDIIVNLRNTLIEMLNNPIDYEYDLDILLQTIRLNVNGDDKLYDIIKQGLEHQLTEPNLKRTIVNLRRTINNYFREQQILNVLNSARYKFTNERDKIKDINQYISEVIGQLEPLQMMTGLRDPAILNEVDIGDEGQVSTIFQAVQKDNEGQSKLKTGWQRLNKMLQGGFRRGEFCVIGALQHKYKTGFTLSLFSQIALYNKPHMKDVSKKPLLLRISFEDDLELNMQFMYQLLKYEETRQPVIIKRNDPHHDEMASYIKQRLQINGYHIKMMRVDPTQSTYKHICNKIIELEANGYEVHMVMIDYLGMVPTTGCINSGPIGTDVRDMFRRIRNFCGPKDITVITPHQLAPDAKQLVRGGTPEDQFVKEVAEKGYWSGSKQLDQEMDLELHIHLFKHQKETYLSVQRGKHRIPTIVNEEDKYFLLKFPAKMPIPSDIDDEDSSYSKLPNRGNLPDENTFKFN